MEKDAKKGNLFCIVALCAYHIDPNRVMDNMSEKKREKNGLRGFRTRSDTNRTVQPQKRI